MSCAQSKNGPSHTTPRLTSFDGAHSLLFEFLARLNVFHSAPGCLQVLAVESESQPDCPIIGGAKTI